MPDLIITGVPRSGTTLAAAIVDRSCDAFCLFEPDSHVKLMQTAKDVDDFVARLRREFDATRQALLAGKGVPDRRAGDGAPVTDYFADAMPGRRREPAFTIRDVSRPGLSPDFVLGAKHNALYAAVLPQIALTGRFRVVGLVRDPVAVLRSWQSLDLPISQGRLPAAERFWPEMAALTHSNMELHEKQIRIYDLLCRRFADLSRQIEVIHYEALVANPAQLLAACGVRASASQSTVAIRPLTAVKDERKAEDSACSARIRQLAEGGSLPGLCHFYSEYRQGLTS
jgi:hypothetical protein